MIRKSILIITGVAAALAVGTAVLFAKQGVSESTKTKSPPAAMAKPALTVTTTRPSSSDMAITLTANGNIMAWQDASIGAEANGLRITDVRVNVGDRV